MVRGVSIGEMNVCSRLILVFFAVLCSAHETLDLSKVPARERFSVALNYVIRTARQNFHTLKGAKIELHGDVKRVWYQTHPALPGSDDCVIPYNEDVYRCEWKAVSPAAIEEMWQRLSAAIASALQPPWTRHIGTALTVSYELPAERTQPALRLELRRQRARRVITFSLGPAGGR